MSDAPPASRWSNPEPRYRVDAIVRRFSRGTRPLLNFHYDAAAVTVNVALSDDADHAGGRLLAVLDELDLLTGLPSGPSARVMSGG